MANLVDKPGVRRHSLRLVQAAPVARAELGTGEAAHLVGHNLFQNFGGVGRDAFARVHVPHRDVAATGTRAVAGAAAPCAAGVQPVQVYIGADAGHAARIGILPHLHIAHALRRAPVRHPGVIALIHQARAVKLRLHPAFTGVETCGGAQHLFHRHHAGAHGVCAAVVSRVVIFQNPRVLIIDIEGQIQGDACVLQGLPLAGIGNEAHFFARLAAVERIAVPIGAHHQAGLGALHVLDKFGIHGIAAGRIAPAHGAHDDKLDAGIGHRLPVDGALVRRHVNALQRPGDGPLQRKLVAVLFHLRGLCGVAHLHRVFRQGGVFCHLKCIAGRALPGFAAPKVAVTFTVFSPVLLL